MALKAGTVGIDPKYVDKNGKPVSDVDLSNYYTKSETDGKLDLKANQSYLTANNKKFQFAYDPESGKYGYKAGAQDDFHPFESAGGIGWVKPATLITTGLTPSNADEITGGYYVDESTNFVYIDLTCKITGSNAYIIGLPKKTAATAYMSMANQGATAADVKDSYICTSTSAYVDILGDNTKVNFGNQATGKYVHVWGMFEKATS